MSKERFGQFVWDVLSEHPIGSLSKRELELALLDAAIKSALIEETPWAVARQFSVTISKAHGYLTDLALRSRVLEDPEGLAMLGTAIRSSEVSPDGRYLAIPIHNAGLRIWLERKLSMQQLQQGESLRRELVKLTPNALLQIMDSSVNGMLQPFDAIKKLSENYGQETWLKASKQHWKKNAPWAKILGDIAIESVCTVLPEVISVIVGMQKS